MSSIINDQEKIYLQKEARGYLFDISKLILTTSASFLFVILTFIFSNILKIQLNSFNYLILALFYFIISMLLSFSVLFNYSRNILKKNSKDQFFSEIFLMGLVYVFALMNLGFASLRNVPYIEFSNSTWYDFDLINFFSIIVFILCLFYNFGFYIYRIGKFFTSSSAELISILFVILSLLIFYIYYNNNILYQIGGILLLIVLVFLMLDLCISKRYLETKSKIIDIKKSKFWTNFKKKTSGFKNIDTYFITGRNLWFLVFIFSILLLLTVLLEK